MKRIATVLFLTCLPGLALANPAPRAGARAPSGSATTQGRASAARAYKDISIYRGDVAPTEHAPLRAKGVMRNTVTAKFGASTHIPNSSFASDTVVVVAEGSAYKGKSVTVGGDTFQDAAIVYLKKNSGMLHTGEFHVLGQAGEEVRLYEMRINDVTPGSATGLTQLDANGGGFWGGDPHFRNLKVKLAASPTDGSAAPIQGYQRDQYSPSWYGYPEYHPQTTWSTGVFEFHDTGASFSGASH